MERLARGVAVGVPRHITKRRNHREAVFLQDADRQLHLALLHEDATMACASTATS